MIVLCLLAGFAPLLARAHPGDALDHAAVFATCTGRYSAIMEHEWLMGRDGISAQAARSGFAALLDAVAASSGLAPRDLLHRRIVAKQAQARLLQQAAFARDPVRARRAGAMARRQMSLCEGLLLG